MDTLIGILPTAKTVSCNMTSNIIIVDNVSYSLYGAVLHSNWNEFNVSGVDTIRQSEFLLHGQKFIDKEKKLNIEVNKYFNIIFMDGNVKKSITIEYSTTQAKIS